VPAPKGVVSTLSQNEREEVREEVSEWIETKARLPEENSGRLEFTSGKGRQTFKGYYRNGQFVAETPPDARSGASIAWAPQDITLWRLMESDEL
jgi:hypothetical protein